MAAPTRGTASRVVFHALIHFGLMLVYFLPGGLAWNRIDPWVLGLPFSVFFEMVLLPVLIVVNMVWMVRSFWRADRSVTTAVRQGTGVVTAERGAPAEPGGATGEGEART